jgi:hypothetical protein
MTTGTNARTTARVRARRARTSTKLAIPTSVQEQQRVQTSSNAMLSV